MKINFIKIKNWVTNNQKILIFVFLWFCIWGTYNTDITRIFSPGFPHSFFDLVHGVRSFLPFLALIFSAVFLFKNNYYFKNIFWSPMGLLIVYSLLQIISSLFSSKPLMAVYWGILYIIVLFFLLTIIKNKEALKIIIKVNLIVAGILSLVLAILFLIQPGMIDNLTYNFLICNQRPFEGMGGLPAGALTFDMAGTRPTGLGRYAGIIAIASLGFFFFTRKRFKINWFVLFTIFLAILFFSKGKTEMVAFIASIIFLIWAVKRINIFSIFGTIFIILISAIVIFYNIPCTNNYFLVDTPVVNNVLDANSESISKISEGNQKPVEIKQVAETPKITSRTASVITLSGRTGGVWRDSWYLFLKNPLFGFGAQADRYFLNGQHAHNTVIHAILQAGILGTLAFVIAFILLLLYVIKLFKNKEILEKEKQFLIIINAVLVFFVVRGITESLAFFSADWLFVAPIIAYIQCLNNEIKNKKTNKLEFDGNKVDMIKMSEVLEKINYWIKNENQKTHWVIVTGMHGVVEAHKHSDFKFILGSADIWVPDGISLVWLGKLKGFSIEERVSGPDLLKEFLKVSQEKGYKNYFYGDTDETLKNLSENYPDLNAEFFSPPFRKLIEQEDNQIIKKINNAKPDILWVGLGLPKQEKWIYSHKDKLKIPVIIGVGAAFKFLAGTKKRAPKIVGKFGFEWLWRLATEPKVVWKRVFIDMPIFFWMAIKSLLFEKN